MAAEIDGASKGLLGAFAVFALGSGIASLIYGVLLLLKYLPIEYSYGSFNLYILSIVLIVVGGLLIITVILGIIGALKDVANVRLVTLILLFILFAVVAVIGVWGMVSFKTGRLEQSINDDINGLSKVSDADVIPKARAEFLARYYNCCTIYPSYGKRENGYIPQSCCIQRDCQDSATTFTERYLPGCLEIFSVLKQTSIFHLSILTLVAAGLVLFALVFYAIVSQRARAGYAAVSRG